jgi:hypothetical protein
LQVRLKTISLRTQKMPNDSTLANSTSAVCSKWWKCSVWPAYRATAAPTIEKAMLDSDMTQNGSTSLTRCDRPPLPHAHLRFSQ